MKRIFSIFAIVAAIAIALPAKAQTPGVYTILNGGTNNVLNGVTNALGTTFSVSDHDYVGIQVSAVGTATSGTGALTFRFASSLDSTTYESTPQHVIALSMNGTTEICKVTNIFIPSIATMKLVGIENAGTNSYVTNIVVKWRVKSPGRRTR